ncbi:right-handed parallel beta-helix repeat-containing protein [Luteolibacter luteus]|uniref:Right handed beta helix domain-containing protein n=1 Tax=Luteolibacter luteus TaxID=2728835 RepID=A0A858RIC7_9BACT|nr:right-handed parallel beta-helix repeat-containing protein [Luteolibacter luteus]QJE96179.1 hypothetical protein HHL09_10410 [Luteolibacter luteus]
MKLGFLPLLAAVAYAEPEALRFEIQPGDNLQDVLNVAREARKGRADKPIEIVLGDGLYVLSKPLEFVPSDSGLPNAPSRLIAAKGAKPVISGGRKITGFTMRPDGLWETKAEGPAFEQLWIGGRRGVRSREPDQGFFRMKGVEEEKHPDDMATQTVEMGDDAMAWLKNLHPAALERVQMLAYHKWDNTRRSIAKVEGNRFITRGHTMKPWNRWDTKSGIVFENLEAGLDEPGEWFLSPEGKLLYKPRPGEDPATTEVVAPLSEKLLVIGKESGDPVQHLQIRGISFQHAAWTSPPGGFEPSQAASPIEAVIQIDHASDITIEDCEVAHTGLYGVWMRDACRNIRVSRCYLHDLGAGGVRIGNMEQGRNTGANLVEDCIIRDGGKTFPCAVGLWIGHSGDNLVRHNEISHFPYTGVSVGWRWGYDSSEAKGNKITHNHIHHIGNGLLSDMGGIYTLGPSEGTVLASNVIHDVMSYDYGGWGLYNDEGSTGILLENNLVYRTTTGGYHQHYGKENIIRNNIFAFARDQQLQFSRAEEHLSFRFTGNIVLWEKGPLWNGGAGGKGKIECDNNLYWRSDGGEIECFGMKFADWQKTGHDQHSVIADPGFADPANGGFRFNDASIPAKIGFKPFDPSEAGVRGDGAWKKLAQEVPADWASP